MHRTLPCSRRFALALVPILLLGCGDSNQMMPAADGGADAPGAADMDPIGSGPMPATWSASHYKVALDLGTRIAHTDVTLTIKTPGNCVRIGFKPPTTMDVALDGAPASDVVVDAAGGTLSACRADRGIWPAGRVVILGVTAVIPKNSVVVKSQVGYSSKKDLAGNVFTYLLSWINGCDHNGPCDAAPDRFATYQFIVAHPDGTQVFCPGTITASATSTTCDFAFAGGPTYSTFGVIAGSSWKPTTLGDWGGVATTLYDYPQTGIAAKLDVAACKAHFAWMASTFGAYPYGKDLRFVVGPTYWAGFEHPGNIALSENLATAMGYADTLRHTVMHEMTHQWAGNHTTIADTYDFFWKEAMAEYLSFVSEDDRISHLDAQVTAATWKQLASGAAYFPVPAEKPALFDYYTDAYGPGPMVLLRQLEIMYSRKAVIDALTAILGGGAPSTVSTDDIRKALEKTTGASLSTYFNGWVYGRGAPEWPVAKVTTTDMGGGSVGVAVAVSTKDGVPRGCAFKVRLVSGDGAKSYDVPVNLGPSAMAFAPVVVQPGFAVAGTVLDPKSECLIYPAPQGGLAAPRQALRPPFVIKGWTSGAEDAAP